MSELLTSLWTTGRLSWKSKKTDLYHRWLLFRNHWGLLRMTDAEGKPTKEAIEVNRIIMTARAFGRYLEQAEGGYYAREEDTTRSQTTGFQIRRSLSEGPQQDKE